MENEIKKYPAAVLRQKAKKIKKHDDPEIQRLIKKMISTMKNAGGLGLAAPQIGKSVQLFVALEADADLKSLQQGKIYVMINPKITSFSKNKVIMEEGCLSFPNKYYSISRPEAIKVRYLDEQGKRCKIKANGIFARIIEHEIDHLNGILIIDYIKQNERSH